MNRRLGTLRLARTRVRKVAALARHRYYWGAISRGVAGAVEHEGVPFSMGFGTVIDVGASRGQFALFATRRFPSARVLCFEPLPTSRAKLKAVIGGRVEIFDRALGETSGSAILNVSAQDDSSSLLPIGQRQVDEFPGTERSGELRVEVGTLAEVLSAQLPGPRLLKIDVQGSELQVLRGAGAGLELIDEVFVECSFVELYVGQALADDVIVFLSQRGFRLVGIDSLSRSSDGGLLQADLLFRKFRG